MSADAAADYETLKARHIARAAELRPDQLARLAWSPERVAQHRLAGLRKLLRHAKTHSAWHARRLSEIDPETIDETSFRAVPTMTKTDLMANFDAIVTDKRLTRDAVEAHLTVLSTDRYLFGEYHVCASGGSSGVRGIFVYDFDAWAHVSLSNGRFSARLMAGVAGGLGAPPVVAVVAAGSATHMTSALSQTFSTGSTHRLPANLRFEEIVAGLAALKPTLLVGYASMIGRLARETLAGRLAIAPKFVSVTSEPLLPEVRTTIAEAWGAPILNAFGCTEGLMGGSCEAGGAIHLSDDLFVVEPVDENGAPARPGTPAAKVYLTNLFNFVQPLIRYELTDEMIFLDGPCPCGMPLVRIAALEGRVDDGFTYPNGSTVHPFAFRAVLGRERDVSEYQVQQTPRGADIRVRTQRPVDLAALTSRIAAALAAAGLRDADVSIVQVDTIARLDSGKLKRFVPLR